MTTTKKTMVDIILTNQPQFRDMLKEPGSVYVSDMRFLYRLDIDALKALSAGYWDIADRFIALEKKRDEIRQEACDRLFSFEKLEASA